MKKTFLSLTSPLLFLANSALSSESMEQPTLTKMQLAYIINNDEEGMETETAFFSPEPTTSDEESDSDWFYDGTSDHEPWSPQ